MTLASESESALSRNEPHSPPQAHKRSPTPPRSTTACEDLASSALLSFHQRPSSDDPGEEDESDRAQTDNAVAEDRSDKSENTLLLNLTEDDKSTRDLNINKMLLEKYFRYPIDGSLRNLIVDELFRKVNALERSELIKNMLKHVDEHALRTILKTVLAKPPEQAPKVDANSRKRDAGFLSPGPGAKRGRLGVEDNHMATSGPSFKHPAGHHDIANALGSQSTAFNPQSALFKPDLASFTRTFCPVDSAGYRGICKDLDHLLAKNTSAINDSPFKHWPSPTSSPPNMHVGDKSGISQKGFSEALRGHAMRSLKMEMERSPPRHPGAHYSTGEAASFPQNQNALTVYSKANQPMSSRYGNLLTPYNPDAMMPKLSFGSNGPSYNAQMFARYHQAGSALPVYKNKPNVPRLKEQSCEPANALRAEVFICPVNDCRKVMRAQRVNPSTTTNTLSARHPQKHNTQI